MSPFLSPSCRLVVPFLAALALAAGCGRPDELQAAGEPRKVYDLVAEFPTAEVVRPTVLIDFDKPAARRRLLSGWSFPESQGDGAAVWSQEVAELEFLVDEVRDLTVHLRCAPAEGAVRPAIVLAINGNTWRHQRLKGTLKRYASLNLPAELLRPGRNLLRITYLSAGRPALPSGRDRVRWDWIRWRPDRAKPTPRPLARSDRSDRKTLFLPVGARLDFFLELPPNGVLKIGKLQPRGAAAGRLQVLWQGAGGDESTLAQATSGAHDVLLPAAGGDGRLSLLALGNGTPATGADGFLMFQPAVHTGAPRRVADGGPAAGPRPNIVLYLIDTLRADHLGCYGYSLDTSPRIDRFAERAALFENAQAQSPWTRSSVASVLTGLLPQIHGANDDDDALAREIVTLAELLRQAGYRTLAVTGNGNAGQGAGFGQGFDAFVHLRQPRGKGTVARSTELNDRAFALLAEHDPDQPFFLFVHTVDPHAPYDPPQPFRDRFAAAVDDPELGSVERMLQVNRRRDIPEQLVVDLLALYDAEIAANDASFGALLDELEERGFYDDSLIMLVSDHGEEFYDHGGWAHGKTLYAEMLDTPLIVKLPGMEEGSRIPSIAEHIDLLPTVADALGLGVPEAVNGRSLLPVLSGEVPADWSDRAVAHFDLRGRTFTSLIDGSWKIIQNRGGDRDRVPELYDRRQDPREQKNLAARHADLAQLLVSIRRSEEAEAGEAFESRKIDISNKLKMREELKALGYLQ